MYELHFLRAFGLTLGIETILLFGMLRWFYRLPANQISSGRLAMTGLLASGATLPYVWFLLPVWIKNFYLYTVLAEMFAVIAEAGIYRGMLRVSWTQAFGLSGICNLGSFGIGRLMAAW
jgi:hypothetical protein